MPVELVLVVVAAPLAAAAIIGSLMLIGSLRGDGGERVTVRIALTAVGVSLLALVALDIEALTAGAPGDITFGMWFAAGGIGVPLGFMLDRLSLPIATLVAVIGFLTLRFSANYLHREPGFHRFFLFTGIFLAGMLTIVLAGSALMAFAGWEFAGVASYLLIGYAYDRSAATHNAVRAFVTNRIGDAGFILGVALAFKFTDDTAWSALAANATDLGAGLIAFGFALAALTKSAQVPFTPWILRALEGPTPSSAIFYGSLMVHAGVYLCLRLEPLLVHTPMISMLLAISGLLTALYGSLAGLAQSDVKSTLLFGTLVQIGLMFVLIGVGAYDIAAWYLGLHAAFRAWQFLGAPSYMHAVDAMPVRPAPRWLARSQRLYTAALERFWLEPLGDALIARPTRALARDMRAMDEQVIARLVGAPGERAAARAPGTGPIGLARGPGVAGALLGWLANRLHAFEQRLLMQGEGGATRQALRALGRHLTAVESLLARPRYLVLIISAIFVAVL